MSSSPAPSQPLLALGLALVVLSCTMLAVRVDGDAQVAVRAVQVLLALLGAVVLGWAAGWNSSRR